QSQIWKLWAQANSRLPESSLIDASNWTVRLAPSLDQKTKLLFCPDDVAPNALSSFGMNDRATRMMSRDDGRIVLLEYKTTAAQVVGQTMAQLNATWPVLATVRHSLRANVTFAAGNTQPCDPSMIDPRYCEYYTKYWQPDRDFKLAL